MQEKVYYTLKSEENWRGIIKLGEKVLLDSNISNKDQAITRNRMASCYHYLGDYKEMENIALQALSNANDCSDIELKVQALYLISAAYRGLKDEKESRKYIDQALKIIFENEISNLNKAKVYFNAGALEHDLCNSLDKANRYYTISMDLFPLGSEEYNRTAIRHIRCVFEKGQINTAKLEADKLRIEPETKTGVQFSMLLSKVYISSQEYHKAYSCAISAKEIADRKSMETESGRLKDLIDSIKVKCPEVESDTGKYINSKDSGRQIG